MKGSPRACSQKRLIEHVRTLYRPDDLALSRERSAGAVAARRSCSRWRCPARATSWPSRRGCSRERLRRQGYATLMLEERRAVRPQRRRRQLVDSFGRVVLFARYPPTRRQQELAYARQHFFLPHRYRDPFHRQRFSTESFVTYDAYDLLMVETRDALGNRVTSVNEIPSQPDVRTTTACCSRAWSPTPTATAREVAFDTLGMVVGTAVMGKAAGACEGDSLDRLRRRPDRKRRFSTHLANPTRRSARHPAARHHAPRLRPVRLPPHAKTSRNPQPRRRLHARPRDPRQRSYRRHADQDPAQLLLLRRLRPRDPEEDPGRAGSPA